MKKRNREFLVTVVTTFVYIGIVIILAIFIVDLNDATTASIYSSVAAILYAVIRAILELVFFNIPIKYKWKIVKSVFSKIQVRVSVANLALIRVKDQHLLYSKIDKTTLKRVYKPVGGVAHFTNDDFMNKFFIQKDEFKNRDPKDLRFFMKFNKFWKLLKYLNYGLYHEVGTMRELKEELGKYPALFNALTSSEQSYLHTSMRVEKTEHKDEVGDIPLLIFYWKVYEINIEPNLNKSVLDEIQKSEEIKLFNESQVRDPLKNNMLDYTNILVGGDNID